ncbi:2-hydroxy-6-oxo-6-phenylhexa-2,4-dienoate hydrolase-like [Ylistrum balloti]|uniref:2-hydroxy-6-oxo-6-phenylhexa-2,4-dienoate hydrolase-like n=1 Tax=Ylistrum balloti TaxID=509963 RepID=UPI00290598AB|nr:2-hydroxy-6-oxo-6-phenylhexa-2,4-dienoate hydrolase-like [Ylistrum balloti]
MTVVAAVPEGKYVDIFDGHKIHYHEAGEGFPVIFIHGSGPGASGWSNFKGNYETIANLANCRCFVPDLLGYGYSSMPEEATFTYDDLKNGIQEFAKQLGLKEYALVGNSMGGAIAITLALECPEQVKQLILMAPGGLEAKEVYMEMKGIRTMIRAMYAPEGITRESMRKVFSLQLHDASLITDDIIEERFQIAEQQPRGMFEKVIVPNQAGQLAELQMPILGFWGVDDQFCPVSGAMIVAKEASQTKMTMLTECGHWVMVEHEAYFNQQCADFVRQETV